jgi:hypothetical protein
VRKVRALKTNIQIKKELLLKQKTGKQRVNKYMKKPIIFASHNKKNARGIFNKARAGGACRRPGLRL